MPEAATTEARVAAMTAGRESKKAKKAAILAKRMAALKAARAKKE